jgi:hypothetical protein
MRRGEYTSLLRQIRHGHAARLAEGCWRVTLPGERISTIMVRATPWQLITILPKDWQPAAPPSEPERNARQTAACSAL